MRQLNKQIFYTKSEETGLPIFSKVKCAVSFIQNLSTQYWHVRYCLLSYDNLFLFFLA